MIFGSVCSGIEAASVAWHPLGWRAAWFSEIEPFPNAVLAYRWPEVKNYGDMTKFEEWGLEPGTIDVLVGGTPCQSFSVAGLRKGLADSRGNLALVFLAIIDRARPRWVVWENVPGVLSSSGGRDFGSFLGGLAELGYRFAYRVLDAQYFGVPQRRRRVFVVGHLGDWGPAAAVLFERESLSGNPPPRREARERVAPTISARTEGGGGLGTDFDCDGGLIGVIKGAAIGRQPQNGPQYGEILRDGTCYTLNATEQHAIGFTAIHENQRAEVSLSETVGSLTSGGGKPWQGYPAICFTDGRGRENDDRVLEDKADALHCAKGPSEQQIVAFTSKDYGADVGESSPTLRAGGHTSSHANAGVMPAVVTTLAIRGRGDSSDLETRDDGTANALLTPNGGRGGVGVGAIQIATQVRRLTPRECERLQGFPDDYTLVEYRGKPACDGPRYKALGNSMAVPVMRWIGKRIEQVERIS